MPGKHPLLDHIIPPDREIIAAKEALAAALRGSEHIVRSGEQFIASCKAGHLLVTSRAQEMLDWTAYHWEKCTDAQSATEAEVAVEA